MNTAAVLPALGIGDALLMMIASHQLKMQGYAVTTFHDALPELAPWFPGHDLQTQPSDLGSYDLIVVENDNTLKIKHLIDIYRSRLSIFYPTYLASKHAPLAPLDRVFRSDLSMVDNIAHAIAASSTNNGLTPLPGLIHRSKKEQVLIHPMSRVPSKNWKAEGFLRVAEGLSERGLKPVFCVGPSEKTAWGFVEKEGFALADVPSLSHLAALVYESGFVIGNDSLMGHLASNLNIPTLIIANDEQRMRLWRPGWSKGQLVLPPPYLPNWKFLRLREKHWQSFISAGKVLRAFDSFTHC